MQTRLPLGELRNREDGMIRPRDVRLQEEFWWGALAIGTGARETGAIATATYDRLIPNV